MKLVETNPPPLPKPAASRPGRRALPSLLFLLGLMLLARVALHYQLPLPACPLREMTGVPCPSCGSTRAFAALAGLDFAGALRLNPLVSLAAGIAGAVWLCALLRGDETVNRLSKWLGANTFLKALLAAALLLNWLYLLLRLPR